MESKTESWNPKPYLVCRWDKWATDSYHIGYSGGPKNISISSDNLKTSLVLSGKLENPENMRTKTAIYGALAECITKSHQVHQNKVERRLPSKRIMRQQSEHQAADVLAFNRLQRRIVESLLTEHAMRRRRQPTTLYMIALHWNDGDCHCWDQSTH